MGYLKRVHLRCLENLEYSRSYLKIEFFDFKCQRMRAGLHLAFDSLFLLAAELPLNSLNTRETSSDFSTAFDHNSRALSSDIELQLRHLRNFPLANKFLVAHHQS